MADMIRFLLIRIPAVLLAVGILSWPDRVLPREPGDDFKPQRLEMVSGQILARDVRDPAVLKAMQTVPRHSFVPPDWRSMAYWDRPLPIGHDQTISQPYIVAKMSELLEIKAGRKILEVGTGSGYQAAVLAEMGAEVFTIEIIAELGQGARHILGELGYGRVQVKIGDGYQGWPEQAPFDGIIVTCAPSHIPQPLQDQLAEGGLMVIPVGPVYGVQQLVLLRKVKGQIQRERIFEVRFVPMQDPKGKPY
jgi:protein-L-isoaspartate(D-aspartate) O-methyltransferase